MSEHRLKQGGRIPVSSIETPHAKNIIQEKQKPVENTSQLYVDMRELMNYYNHRTTPSKELKRSVTALREYSRTIPYTQFIDEILTRYPHILLEPGADDHINLSDPYCDNNTQRNSKVLQFLGSIRTAYDINDIFNTK